LPIDAPQRRQSRSRPNPATQNFAQFYRISLHSGVWPIAGRARGCRLWSVADCGFARLSLPSLFRSASSVLISGEVSGFQFPIFGNSGDFGNLCPSPLPSTRIPKGLSDPIPRSSQIGGSFMALSCRFPITRFPDLQGVPPWGHPRSSQIGVDFSNSPQSGVDFSDCLSFGLANCQLLLASCQIFKDRYC
jgi:hypothetical protein